MSGGGSQVTGSHAPSSQVPSSVHWRLNARLKKKKNIRFTRGCTFNAMNAKQINCFVFYLLGLFLTWYPGLHLYLQRVPTFRPVSLQRFVCSTALATGGGAAQRSSQSASGKDHSPSSRHVRVLFVPKISK